MKRIPPHWGARLQRAGKSAGKTLAWTMTSAATTLTIAVGVGIALPAWTIYAAAVWCFAPPSAVLLWRSQSHHLPDVIVDDDSPDESYEFRYCTAADLREANSWTKPYYRHEYVTDAKAESWRAKAPRAFVGLYNSREELCAAFGIIAIESSFMKQFVKGRIKDNELAPDDLLDDEAARKSPELYISGVVVREPDGSIGHKRACAMVWGMAKFLERRYGFRRKRTVYALAVSKTSKNSLVRAGFHHFNGPNDRADQLELYCLDVTKERIATIITRVGDYSGRCRIQFDSLAHGGRESKT
jgi:hypothetical protein